MERQNLFQNEDKRFRVWDAIECLVKEAHDNALDHGFYAQIEKNHTLLTQCEADLGDGYLRDFKLSQLAKIGEECGEACHALRKGLDEEFVEELADVIIRTLDLAGFCTTPDMFAHALLGKMERNIKRERLHGRLC